MKKRVLKKEKLDETGANLFKAVRMTDTEIENIVNKPQLFASVVARIKAEEINQRAKVGGRQRLPNINFRFVGAAATALVLVIAAIITYNGLRNSDENQLAQIESVANPQIAAASAEKVFPPVAAVEPKPIVKAATQAAKSIQPPRNSISQRKSPRKSLARQPPRVPDSTPAAPTYADEGEFYALPFAPDPADDEEASAQIVRSVFSRADLAAFGIELPPAFDEEKFLTDVLYGSRGNPQAFRVVAVF